MLTGLRVDVARTRDSVARLIDITLAQPPPRVITPPPKPLARQHHAEAAPKAQRAPLGGSPGPQPAHATTPAPAPVASSPPPAKGGAGALDPALAKGIQKLSATEYNIDRGVVDKILENQADLMRQARIVPEQENGKVVGIRMFGVRPETLLGHLGMENGDRLQTINGFDMASPEKALEAYARLRTADKLTVSINRRGQNMNLDYNIR